MIAKAWNCLTAGQKKTTVPLWMHSGKIEQSFPKLDTMASYFLLSSPIIHFSGFFFSHLSCPGSGRDPADQCSTLPHPLPHPGPVQHRQAPEPAEGAAQLCLWRASGRRLPPPHPSCTGLVGSLLSGRICWCGQSVAEFMKIPFFPELKHLSCS